VAGQADDPPHGLRYHKLKHYVDGPAEITGVIVRNGRVVVPNRQRLKQEQLLTSIQRTGGGDDRQRGRLSGLDGQIRQINAANNRPAVVPPASS
jgi:hypothetical protein